MCTNPFLTNAYPSCIATSVQKSCTGAGKLFAGFDFAQHFLQLATSGPPEMWQDHQVSRAGGPMVHCLDM